MACSRATRRRSLVDELMPLRLTRRFTPDGGLPLRVEEPWHMEPSTFVGVKLREASMPTCGRAGLLTPRGVWLRDASDLDASDFASRTSVDTCRGSPVKLRLDPAGGEVSPFVGTLGDVGR